MNWLLLAEAVSFTIPTPDLSTVSDGGWVGIGIGAWYLLAGTWMRISGSAKRLYDWSESQQYSPAGDFPALTVVGSWLLSPLILPSKLLLWSLMGRKSGGKA